MDLAEACQNFPNTLANTTTPTTTITILFLFLASFSGFFLIIFNRLILIIYSAFIFFVLQNPCRVGFITNFLADPVSCRTITSCCSTATLFKAIYIQNFLNVFCIRFRRSGSGYNGKGCSFCHSSPILRGCNFPCWHNLIFLKFYLLFLGFSAFSSIILDYFS